MFRFLLLYPLLLFSVLNTSAQKRSAQKLFNKAISSVDKQEGMVLLLEAIAKDISYTEAYLNLARLYNQAQQYEQQVSILQDASEHCERKLSLIYAQLSKAAYQNGDYLIAKSAANQFDTNNNSALEQLRKSIDFSIAAISHPSPFEAINLGEQVNTKYHDYWPSLSIDEQQITTTVFVETDTTAQEDLFYSSKAKNEWQVTKPLKIINSEYNEGAQCLSADGKIMLFTACNRLDGVGNCDIYIAHQTHGEWSTPAPLPPPLNTKYWEGHPSLSADGKELFFSSNRKGGQGGRDLYAATITLGATTKISQLKNLGEKVNTSKNEISPFIHPDGKTLYFSSDGHIGLGRQDIYYAQRDSNDFVDEPINFGCPINTHSDEIGLVVNTRGDKGYFSTERKDSQKRDIYTFDIPKEAQANKVTYLSACVSDCIENKAIKADVEIGLTSTGEIVYKDQHVSDFTIPLNFGENYAIHVTHSGYLFYSENIAVNSDSKSPFEKRIKLSPLLSGERIVLRNVFFEHNAYHLDKGYTDELDKAIRLIKDNPKLQFEVSGHTDDSGSPSYNLTLSEQRAKVVYDYFVAHGVEKHRLTYKGCGQSQPVSNERDENRRTELLVK